MCKYFALTYRIEAGSAQGGGRSKRDGRTDQESKNSANELHNGSDVGQWRKKAMLLALVGCVLVCCFTHLQSVIGEGGG